MAHTSFFVDLLLGCCSVTDQYMCSVIEKICNICTAAGGLGTVGTLVYMIVDSIKKGKQIKTIQSIQSYQLESLFEPDIRISSWTSKTGGKIPNEIIIDNYSEDLVVLNIIEMPEYGLLDVGGMARWFPLHFDKGKSIHIPLSLQLSNLIKPHKIIIVCKNRLGLIYESCIQFESGKPSIVSPVIKNNDISFNIYCTLDKSWKRTNCKWR